MRFRIAVAMGGALLLVACSNDVDAPLGPDVSSETISLVPDYALSPAADIDGSGVGAAMLPEELELSAEQKAAIQALHEAFMAANKADIDALAAIEAEARAARQAGKSREEIRAILARGRPILDRLHAALHDLREAIWAIYTPAQRAWILAHRPRACGPFGAPNLTEAQIAAIKALRESFVTTNQADLDLIKATAAEARAARAAGASADEIRAILARASDAMQRVRQAERELHAAILALLTPEQRAARCLLMPGR